MMRAVATYSLVHSAWHGTVGDAGHSPMLECPAVLTDLLETRGTPRVTTAPVF
jgi:hypothetical protein